MQEIFEQQVELMLQVLPLVAKSELFALKGGTAINFFIQNMPRLSVDIDLTYIPIGDRASSLSELNSGINAIAEDLKISYPGISIHRIWTKDRAAISRLDISNTMATIKLEPNHVLRGTLEPVETRNTEPRPTTRTT